MDLKRSIKENHSVSYVAPVLEFLESFKLECQALGHVVQSLVYLLYKDLHDPNISSDFHNGLVTACP